ncbi:hypothetical protein C2845_PM11G25560 [Panicum miliaceum]|uniref:Uncharacterized protein n=1 Tax=Panicum miliaceum TaxID=4540 RepID=A0A3L6RST6_PANMI|nr:hypothetical protein C2845_PM11G25560 [Panicum miliaceum]
MEHRRGTPCTSSPAQLAPLVAAYPGGAALSPSAAVAGVAGTGAVPPTGASFPAAAGLRALPYPSAGSWAGPPCPPPLGVPPATYSDAAPRFVAVPSGASYPPAAAVRAAPYPAAGSWAGPPYPPALGVPPATGAASGFGGLLGWPSSQFGSTDGTSAFLQPVVPTALGPGIRFVSLFVALNFSDPSLIFGGLQL